MIAKFKRIFYFPVASYFQFFANIRLRRWNPKIVIVTGSNGKTTLLHMLEAQIGDKAKYSHHANSSFGIPFDILDLHRKTLLRSEWIELFMKAPFNAFMRPPKDKLYIIEADCDRAGEGKFLASFLRPSIVLWVSTAKTHSMSFEHLVGEGKFKTVEEAIAYEFGYFLEYCRDLAITNGDSVLMERQIKRTKAKVIKIKNGELDSYKVDKEGTVFTIANKKYAFKDLLPEEVFYSIAMCQKALEEMGLPFDNSFSKFSLPPGRGSIFQGIRNTTIVDSSYNANLSSVKAILSMFGKIPGKKKWVILADMLELGKEEKAEHEELAFVLNKLTIEKIILIGPKITRYAFPKVTNPNKICFPHTKDSLQYILDELSGGELLLFKGSQSFYLEGVIEKLLNNTEDSKYLPRRGKGWEVNRTRIGLDR